MDDPRPELIQLAHLFYTRGWMISSAGSLSSRLHDDSLWVMAHNTPRRNMDAQDFIRISLQGEIIARMHAQDEPSKDTDIHLTIYQMFPRVGACYVVPSIEANIVSNIGKKSVPLPQLEVIKEMTGNNFQAELPIFENHAQPSEIANDIYSRFQQYPPSIPALLIRNHSMVVWASSIVNALNYLESLDYVLRYIVGAKKNRALVIWQKKSL